MIIFFKNHWHQKTSKFIFDNKEVKGASEAVKADEKDFYREIKIPKLKPGMTDKEVRQEVDKIFKEHTVEKYNDEITAFTNRHIKNPEVADRLIKDAVARYKTKYDEAVAAFYARNYTYEDSRKQIEKANIANRQLLAGAVNNAIDTRELKLEFNNNITHSEANKKFTELYETLNRQYFNFDWQKEHLSTASFDQYHKLAIVFKDGIENYVENRLKYIFEDFETKGDKTMLLKRLEKLNKDITDAYQETAGRSGNKDGFIDLADLTKLDKHAKQYKEIMYSINMSDNDEELAKQLDMQGIFNPEFLEKAMADTAKKLIQYAVQNGTEEAFTQMVKKMTGSTKKMDFDDAASEFRSFMQKTSKKGGMEILKVLRNFNANVNKERAEILQLSRVKNPVLKSMVHKERKMLLSRKTKPKNDDDFRLIEFMSTNRIGRTTILNNETERRYLFQAIQNIQKNYPGKYKKMIPKKITKVKSSSDADRPHSYDKAARIMALLTLAEEAEWVIKNLDKTKQYKGQKIYEQLELTKAEKAAPGADSRFHDAGKLYKTNYRTVASRNGFNGKEIGLSTLKALAGFTIFINFMNAKKELGWKAGTVSMLTNPYIWAGVGIYKGVDWYRDTPESAKYLFEDEGGQRRISTHLDLASISRRRGYSQVMNLIANANEFKSMEYFTDNKQGGLSRLDKLIKKVEKRKDPKLLNKPGITREDLKEAGISSTFYSQISGKSYMARTRYLFYKKLLNKKTNIRELQANCLKWDATPKT